MIVVPLSLDPGERGRVGKAVLGGDIRADDVVEIRPHGMTAAFVDRMAGFAFVEHALSRARLRRGQQGSEIDLFSRLRRFLLSLGRLNGGRLRHVTDMDQRVAEKVAAIDQPGGEQRAHADALE